LTLDEIRELPGLLESNCHFLDAVAAGAIPWAADRETGRCRE
jgi:hypothetical protein